MLFTVVTFIAFTVLVAVISWWKARDDDPSIREGYCSTGRGLPGIVIAGSLMMTNFSVVQLIGTNGQSFAGSMSAMTWVAASVFALVVLAFVFLPKLIKCGIATIPEFFEKRYDTFTMRLLSVLVLIANMVILLPAILYSGAVALVHIFDIQELFGISYFSAITFLCIGTGVIGIFYAVLGGLKAVKYSGTIHGVGLIIGGLAIPILGFIALGKMDGGGFVEGIQHFISATPEKMNAWSAPNALPPEIPWPLLFTGMFVNNLFYWTTNQSIIQRSLGGRNLAESQKGVIWASFLKCLDVFIIVIPGIIAFQLLAANGQINTSVGLAADKAYPLLVMELIPRPLMGFFAAVMFGAILAFFGSIVNSASAIFTQNIWQPFRGKGAGVMKAVKAGKFFGIIVGVVSIVISPFVMYFDTGIMNFINEGWGFFSVPLLTAVLFGLLSKRAPAIAPKIVVPVHIGMYGLTKIISFFSQFHYLYIVFVLFVLECIIYAVCIKVCPREIAWEIPDAKVIGMTPWKAGENWAIVVLAVVAIMYYIFSPLCIG